MSRLLPVPPAPDPLETYVLSFDLLFTKRNQREAFRQYLQALLQPAQRRKTVTALANTEPNVGAQKPEAQRLQRFLSESTWNTQQVNIHRLGWLLSDQQTAPTLDGVLVIEELMTQKGEEKTIKVSHQNPGCHDTCDAERLTVSSFWANERYYYPLEVEPYNGLQGFTSSSIFGSVGTRAQLALELIERARTMGIPFRALVADYCFGEDVAFRLALDELGIGYVIGLHPSYPSLIYTTVQEIGYKAERMGVVSQRLKDRAEAEAKTWKGYTNPGNWIPVKGPFRSDLDPSWWALEVVIEPGEPPTTPRLIVITPRPQPFSDTNAWYLITNLPAPGGARAQSRTLDVASLAEIVRLYGIRMWLAQSYDEILRQWGWAQYQVRNELAIRRHWTLVSCAFTFCLWQANHTSSALTNNRRSSIDHMQSTTNTGTSEEPEQTQSHEITASISEECIVEPCASEDRILEQAQAILKKAMAKPLRREVVATEKKAAGQTH